MALRKRRGGGNFLNLLQKERGTQKGGVPSEKRGVRTLEKTMQSYPEGTSETHHCRIPDAKFLILFIHWKKT